MASAPGLVEGDTVTDVAGAISEAGDAQGGDPTLGYITREATRFRPSYAEGVSRAPPWACVTRSSTHFCHNSNGLLALSLVGVP
jgi:hypothetical protein